MIKTFFEKIRIYVHIYGLISYYWLKLIFAKWRFSRQEEKFIKLKFDIERKWQILPYLNKRKARTLKNKLQAIEKMLQNEEREIKNTRLDLSFIEEGLRKMINITKQK